MKDIIRWLQQKSAARPIKRQSLVLGLLAPFVLAGSVMEHPYAQSKEEEVKPIVILIEDSPLSYRYNKKLGANGWHYDLIHRWAEQSGLDFVFEVVKSRSELVQRLRTNQGDIAVGSFAILDDTYNDLLVGPEIDKVNYSMVCKKGANGGEENPLRILFPPSAHIYTLLEPELKETPHQITFHLNHNPLSIFENVKQGEFDCGVVNSLQAYDSLRFFPKFELRHDFSEEYPLGWLLASNAEDLHQSLLSWVEDFKTRELWNNIRRQYFDYQNAMDSFESMVLKRRMETRLPKYVNLFKAAAEHYELPWELVAAVSYQESHWRPNAKSYTGVRGIMQLTTATADYLGVKNRIDVAQSIWGGAKYLRILLDRTPESANSHDRFAMALAAYNVGWGHVEDARQLVLESGKDPNAWGNIKDVLPLLAKKAYFTKTRYGYARGWEPVTYVDRIKNYYEMISYNASEMTAMN